MTSPREFDPSGRDPAAPRRPRAAGAGPAPDEWETPGRGAVPRAGSLPDEEALPDDYEFPAPLGDAVDEVPDSEDEDYGLAPSWSIRPLIYLAALVAIAAGVVLAVQRVARGGMADQLKTTFQDVSLLPAEPIKSPGSDMQLQVYYPVRGLTLAPFRLKLTRPAGVSERLTLIARALETPPDGGLLASPLQSGAKIRGVYLLDNVAWVDLSPEFLKPSALTPQSQRVLLYSIIDSINLNEPAIAGVRFMIGGAPINSAWGWMDLSTALGPDISLIH